MADLVVRATLRDNVLPQLARIAAGMQALEKQMDASSKRMASSSQRNASKTNAEIFKIDNAMRGTARRMASRVLLIGAAIAAAAGHAVAFTAALWPMIGALGAVPAITVGFVAGIAALITGFSGLGAAMKKTGGGSGAAASQITSAQRRIEMANRSLRDSQESLNDAWETARDNLRDIQTQYAGAQLDVEAAALAVRDAELALREARSSGDRQERARADLALRQARLNQIEATNRLSDVEQEFQERMAQGVEGSDEVRDASERHADALYELAEAQDALNEAMKGGGGGGGNDAYAKLSASAKKLVDTFRALGPVWRQVKLATQEALFAGVAEDVQRLSDKYLPVMLRQLPRLAQGWNNMFRSIAGVVTQGDRVRDLDESLGLMATMWQKVGTAFGKFFAGFIDWVRVGADFMPRLGDWVDRQADRWADWSAEVRATGRAHKWIEDALVAGRQFNQLLGSWLSSLGKIMALGRDDTLLPRLIEGSRAFREWLDTAEGSERITGMWTRMREVGTALWTIIKEVFDILSQVDLTPTTVILGLLADALGVVGRNMDFVNGVLGPLIVTMIAYKAAAMAIAAVNGLWVGSTSRVNAVTGKSVPLVDRLTAGLGLLAGVFALNAIASEALSNAFGKKLNPNVNELADDLKRYVETGQRGAEMTRVLGEDADDLAEALSIVGKESTGVARFFEDMGIIQKVGFDEATEEIAGLDQALSKLVTEGNGDAAAAMFEIIAAAAAAQGIPIERVMELLPGYIALLEAGEGVQQDATFAIQGTANAWRDAQTAGEAYSNFLRGLTNPLARFNDAQKKVAEAERAVTDAMNQFGTDSPEYEDAVLDLAQAKTELAGAASEAATAAGLTDEALRQIYRDAGHTEAEIEVLINKTHEAKEAFAGLHGARARMFVEVVTSGALGIVEHLKAVLKNAFPFFSFHQGGIVPGAPGQEVAAVLEAGEMVVPYDQVQKGAPTGAPMDVNIYLHMEPAGVVKMVRKEVRARGGNVQVALGVG